MRLLSLIIAIIYTFASFATNRVDSVNVLFKVARHNFDPALGNNRAVMDSFVNIVRDAAAAGNLERITVYGYASPDGRFSVNQKLARNRCSTIAAYIATHADIAPDLIEQRPSGIGWDELRRLVAENPDVPYRLEVLDILDNTPVWVFDKVRKGRVVSSRKKKLMDLAGGRAWRWLMNNLYPELRNAVGISISRIADKENQTDGSESAATVEDAEQVTAETETTTVETTVLDFEENIELADQTASEPYTHIPSYRLALKTNMLYDAILMPNLELEWLIDSHWSAALEANVAWWNHSYDRTYRVAHGVPEVRYHVKPRAEWHGMYVGAFAGGGFYDLCGKKNGYRGPAVMGGLSLGYMWPISRRFELEAAVGVGYMYSHYKHYTPLDGHKVYLRTRNLHYFGPLKLKFSLAWLFYDINKNKRVFENK